MLSNASGSIRPATIGLVVACLVVAGVVGASIAGGSAPRALKKVVVKNGLANPVPISSKPPVLRNGRLDVFAGSSATVPAGVVLTDLVVWSMSGGTCSVILEPGSEGGIRLAPKPDANDGLGAELHLESGIPSTDAQPLVLRAAGGPTCSSIAAHWSGYER